MLDVSIKRYEWANDLDSIKKQVDVMGYQVVIILDKFIVLLLFLKASRQSKGNPAYRKYYRRKLV